MLAVLAFFSCGRAGNHSAGSQLTAAPSSSPPPSKAIALTGAGTGGSGNYLNGGGGNGREVAHPQTLQYLWDHTQTGINPWGPVQYTVAVPTLQGNISANRLSSPDPFTATWQLNDGTGTILVTNLDITQGLGQVEADVEPPTLFWAGPDNSTVEIYQNEIVVWYRDTVTESQVWNEISAKNLHVIMSWWEPKDDESPGNEIAYFHFQYDPEIFPTFTAAFNYFSTSPLVDLARPAIKGEWGSDYVETTNPNDPYYQGPPPMPHRNRHVSLLAVDSGNFTSIGPPYGENFSNVDIAVIDDGVWRWHPDFSFTRNGQQWSKISWVGVECMRSSYLVVTGGAIPVLTTDGHGTGVSGLITAVTNNSAGVAGLSPRSCVVPVRLKYYGPADNRKYNEDSLVKGVRALRFEFSHVNWADDIRVVNMSISGDRFPYWWDPSQDLKTNISRDLKLNDRLYVASAGNRGQDAVPSLRYPAAFDNVLGVTGLITNANGTSWWADVTLSGGQRWGSNYYPDNYSTYPISGIYDFVYLYQGTYYQDQVGFSLWGPSGYLHFNGTSAATPEVAAIARQLYAGRPLSNYRQVWNRIVATRDDSKARSNIAGLVDYEAALENW
jgi:hypothetical protein